jgi:hypothetical protein
MNHGIVCYCSDVIPSLIWNKVMTQGVLAAIYTTRSMERFIGWESAFARSLGEPPELDPEGYGTRPGYRHPAGEYARYEPMQERQFRRMYRDCEWRADSTLILPATASDEEAMRLLGELHALMPELRMRLLGKMFDKRKRKRSECRLCDVIRPVRPGEGWACFLSCFKADAPAVVFLSDDLPDVESIYEAVNPDGFDYRGVERW